jgi:hypothetical protein
MGNEKESKYMSKIRLFLIICSIAIWMPTLNIIFNIIPLTLNRSIVVLMYLLLLICPVLSIINIIIVLVNYYRTKTFSIVTAMLLLSNILFLTIGMKYLKDVAWLV